MKQLDIKEDVAIKMLLLSVLERKDPEYLKIVRTF